MHIIDGTILVIYLISMLGIGLYFMRNNQDRDDYFVGGRNLSSLHIGLSLVATDVGGGFSIGLGGLGFAIGLSGSWMLFTGLIGAWLSAVWLIPKIKGLEKIRKFYTFPEVLGHFYDRKVSISAAIITTIGYIGFTSSQLLAGAKLASSTMVDLDLQTALWIMGILAIAYTAIGGLKAVIYTDTIQWGILMFGLIFIGIPVGYSAIGGMDEIIRYLPASHLTLTNIKWTDLMNWSITIIPIWFIGMTLYQRIYACKDVHTARRAWYIAGLLEWPAMAFMGIILGVLSRVAYMKGLFLPLGFSPTSPLDSELGLPLLLRSVLPIGMMGILLAAYFSAILSTADSCLMAASGSLISDLFKSSHIKSERKFLLWSQLVTFVTGLVALLLASQFNNVLELMLYSYSFMVSGLFIPLIMALFAKEVHSEAAMVSMISGGSLTLILTLNQDILPLPFGLNPNLLGILLSFLSFLAINGYCTRTRKNFVS